MITSSCRQLQLIPSVVFAVGRRELRVPRQKRPHTPPATILSCQDCRRQRPAAKAPQPADATPARTRTQRPCGPESRCAAASSSSPVTTAHAQASRTNGAAIAIAGQARTAAAAARFVAPSRISNRQRSSRGTAHPRQNYRSNMAANIRTSEATVGKRKVERHDEQNRGSTAQPDSPPVTRQTALIEPIANPWSSPRNISGQR